MLSLSDRLAAAQRLIPQAEAALRHLRAQVGCFQQ